MPKCVAGIIRECSLELSSLATWDGGSRKSSFYGVGVGQIDKSFLVLFFKKELLAFSCLN
jgi:hypothetical protein